MSFPDCEWKTPELNAGLIDLGTLEIHTQTPHIKAVDAKRFSPVMLQGLIRVTSL